MKKHRYIAVMGTIGSGKTTASGILSKNLKMKLLEENFGENAFLPRFYKEMKQWAFHSQTFFLMEKISQLFTAKDILDKRSVIQDTPIQQDVFSYAKAQFVLGHMDAAEWKLYQKIYYSLLPQLPQPDTIIYLKTSLESIKTRIAKRSRNFESQIPEGYLELLEMLNEKWLKKDLGKTKLVTIETDDLNIVKSPSDKKKFIDLAVAAI